MSNIYYWEKLTFSKTRFSWKKTWRNALVLKSKQVQGIFGYFGISLQLSFAYKTMSQISFNLFCLWDKRLFSEFLRKWGWFHEHNEPFPKYLGWKLKFQNIWDWFCRWKSNGYNDINIFMSLKHPCTFCWQKKKNTWKHIYHTNGEKSKKISKNCVGKQIMPFKSTVNWLFNDIWCYLVIDSFDWKIGIFQQL